MPKPNEPCPCGSDKKYKKCCKPRGLFTKKREVYDPSKWQNSGESDPSLRFAVGDRVECLVGELEANGDPKWTPCTIRHLHFPRCDGTPVGGVCVCRPACTPYPYQCLLDYPLRSKKKVDSFGGERIASITSDTNTDVRPLGFTKSVANYQECGKCGVHECVEGVELLNCSGCKRIRYCSIEHLHADRKNHKAFCRAIIKENKRSSL